jgi:hypothetical protein
MHGTTIKIISGLFVCPLLDIERDVDELTFVELNKCCDLLCVRMALVQ